MLRSTSLHGAKDTKSDPIVSSLSWFIFHLAFSKQSLILFSVWWVCFCFDWSEQPASIISLWAKERRSNFHQCFFRCEAKHFWRENSNEMFLAGKFKWDVFGGKIQTQLLFTFPFSMLNKTPPSFKIETDSGIIGDDNVSATFWSTPTSPGFVALSSVEVDIDDVRVALTSTTTMSTLFSWTIEDIALPLSL